MQFSASRSKFKFSLLGHESKQFGEKILDFCLYILIAVCATVHSSCKEKLDFGHFEE